MRDRLTFANVMSVLAVFIALGGSALAISRNSVGTRELKRDAVKSKIVKDGQIKSRDVKDGNLTGEDFANDSIDGSKIKPDSITGREIFEAFIDITDFFKMDDDFVSCDPTSTAFVECGKVTLNLNEASQALLASGGAVDSPTGAQGVGTCQFRIAALGLPFPDLRRFLSSNVISDGYGFALNATTPSGNLIPKGTHDFILECNEESGDVRFRGNFSVFTLGGLPNS